MLLPKFSSNIENTPKVELIYAPLPSTSGKNGSNFMFGLWSDISPRCCLCASTAPCCSAAAPLRLAGSLGAQSVPAQQSAPFSVAVIFQHDGPLTRRRRGPLRGRRLAVLPCAGALTDPGSWERASPWSPSPPPVQNHSKSMRFSGLPSRAAPLRADALSPHARLLARCRTYVHASMATPSLNRRGTPKLLADVMYARYPAACSPSRR